MRRLKYYRIMNEHNFWFADCHCDTLGLFEKPDYEFQKDNDIGHLDLPRMRRGNVKLQFFAVCVASNEKYTRYLDKALAMVNSFHRCIDKNSAHLAVIKDRHDLPGESDGDRTGCLLALEGAEPLEGSAELIEVFYRLGVRALSLTWNKRNRFADGVAEAAAAGGLSTAGQKTVRQMAELGIVLDLAHISPRGFDQAMDISPRPPLVSHANARSICDHPRNLDDGRLKLLASREGVIGISYCPSFVSHDGNATLERLADHFVHVAAIIGVEHVAIGSDFDGIERPVSGLDDASCHRVLIAELSRRGFHSKELALIAGGNVKKLLLQNLPGADCP